MKKNKPSYSIFSNVWWMLKMSWRSSRSVPFMCIVIALVNVAQSVLQLYASPAILNAVETHQSLGQLLLTILVFSLGLILVSGLISYLGDMILYPKINVRIQVISRMCKKQGTTSYPNTENPEVLKTLDKAVRAVSGNNEAAEAIWDTLMELTKNLLGFSIYLTILSNLHPAIAVVTILTAVAGFFAEQRFHGWGYRHREEQSEIDHQISYARKTAHNREFAQDFRIFGMADWLREVYDKSLGMIRDFKIREHWIYLWADMLEVALSFLRSGFAYVILIAMVLRNGMSAADFILYFAAASGFSAWIGGILQQSLTLHRQSLELCTIREYLDIAEPFRMTGGAPITVDPEKDYELRLENVSFRYPEAETDTIHNMNLTIRPGEKLAIVGENGAGKTTLIKLLCGLYDPTEGRVLLNGQDIREFNRPKYYKLFSAVFQEYSVLDVTVRENITQTCGQYDERRMKEAVEKAGLTEKIEAIGWETHLGRDVFEDGVLLSGGQTQRLILARALYKNGPVLVLDEPTAALDPIAENDIYQKYASMTEGRTSVFISHRLASTRFCDRILLLDRGAIAEEGTHESLLAKNGAYAEMFNIQKKYYQEEKAQ